MTEKYVHSLEHVHFEDTAGIFPVLSSRGYKLSRSRLYEGDSMPEINSFELLLIMGGPMGVHDGDKYSWLKPEKFFIEKCISSGKKIIGICLGAQLLADVFGARVYKNKFKEIGWHRVCRSADSIHSSIFKDFPDEFTAFQWHGDTFEIPSGCIKTAQSEACANQSFVYNERVAALQFHLESTDLSIKNLIKYSGDEIINAPYIQDSDFIIKKIEENRPANDKLLDKLLDHFL